jgi:hypothetical protein
MNPAAFKKTTCRLLVVPLLALSFQTAHAGRIGAEPAADPQPASERTMLLSTLDRADVVAQLQAVGVDPAAARARVQSMTEQEVHAMAQQVQTAPAAGVSTWGWVAIVLVAALIWYTAIRT